MPVANTCYSLLALLLVDGLEPLTVLVHSHGTSAALGALSALGSGRRSGRDGFLTSSGGLASSLLSTSSKGINSSGSLRGSLGGSLLGRDLLALDLSTTGSLRGLLSTSEGDNLGVALLDLPFSAGVGHDSLADLALSTRDGSHVDLLGGGGGAYLSVTEGLDSGLEFIVSVEVGGVTSRVEGLLKLRLEGVDDKAALNTGVRGEDLSGVDTAELEAPFGDNDDLAFEIKNVDLREFALVLRDGGLGEVGGHIEERVRDEEVGSGLFNEDLEVLSEEIFGERIVFTTRLDHLGVKSLESGGRTHLFFFSF